MNKYFKKIERIFELTKFNKIRISAYKSILAENYDVFISEITSLDYCAYGEVQYENDNYTCIQVFQHSDKLNNDEIMELLSSSFEVLFNLDTVLNYGIEIHKKKNDYTIIRNVIKEEYDQASEYWENELECPKCHYNDIKEEFTDGEEWDDAGQCYIYCCPECGGMFKEEE